MVVIDNLVCPEAVEPHEPIGLIQSVFAYHRNCSANFGQALVVGDGYVAGIVDTF
ncbi:hypothetical protein D3C78_1686710 [compost metagenome]